MFLDLLDEIATGKKDAGVETRYNCPFCNEQRQKFYVQNHEPYLWHCKYCDRSGNPVKLVMEYYSVGYPHAKEMLESYDYYLDNKDLNRVSEFYDDKLSDAEQLALIASGMSGSLDDSKSTHKLIPTKLPEGFKYLKDNVNNREAFPFINYLYNRGINMSMIVNYDIGYVVNGFFEHPGTGKNIPILSSIVFPTKDIFGNIIYWNTRAIASNAYVKSINAPSDSEHYSKNDTIFNLYNAVKTGHVVISEGVFNAMMSGISGVATFGKQITDSQIELLKEEYNKNSSIKFYVFLDNDAKKEILTLAKKLYDFTENVYLVINPYKGKDANDLGYSVTKELILSAKKYNPNSGIELSLLIS